MACLDECRVVSLWEYFFLLSYSNNVTILEGKYSLYKKTDISPLSNPLITAFSSTWESSYILRLLHLELSFCAMCYFIDLCTFSFRVSCLPVWISCSRYWFFVLEMVVLCVFSCVYREAWILICYPYGNDPGLESSPWTPAFVFPLSSFLHAWFKEECNFFFFFWLILRNKSFPFEERTKQHWINNYFFSQASLNQAGMHRVGEG